MSITWRFAVEALAAKWGADFSIGTGLTLDGKVEHFWSADKAEWLSRLMLELNVSRREVAAVGDSNGDLQMLAVAGRGYFVGARGAELPEHVSHWPASDITAIVEDIVDHAS